jgi:hypothetical protein
LLGATDDEDASLQGGNLADRLIGPLSGLGKFHAAVFCQFLKFVVHLQPLGIVKSTNAHSARAKKMAYVFPLFICKKM